MFLVVSSAAFVSQSSLQMRRKMSNESQSKLFGFFDDLMKGTPMGKKQEPTEMPVPSQSNLREVDGDGDEEWNESDFRNELQKRDVRDQAMDAGENESSSGMDRGNVIAATDEEESEEETEFDGYMVRAIALPFANARLKTVADVSSYVRHASFSPPVRLLFTHAS